MIGLNLFFRIASLSIFTTLLLAGNASAQATTKATHYEDHFQKLDAYFKKTNLKSTSQPIEGEWGIQRIALRAEVVSQYLGTQNGQYPELVRNKDGSLRNNLKFTNPASLVIGGLKKKNITQAPSFTQTEKQVQFKLNAYDENGIQTKTHYLYSCKPLWSIYENELLMICSIQFIVDPSELWADEVMQWNKKTMAYYIYKKL